MSFFFNITKTEEKKAPPKKRSGHIPIHALQEMGCKVCPRDKEHDSLTSPKMRPTGSDIPDVYVLVAAPSLSDDDRDEYLTDRPGRAVMKRIPRDMDRVRFNSIVNCASDTQAVDQHEIECCRGRVVRDIEETQPLVIMGVGDAPLRWATGLTGKATAPTYHGQLMAVKIGNHSCWYYPVIYPNFVFSSSRSDHEGVFIHDIRRLMEMVETRDLPPPPTVYTGDYDAGLTIITGDDDGDMLKLERELEWLVRQPRCGLDIEATGLRPYPPGSKILTMGLATFERGVAYAMDFEGNQWGGGWKTERQRKKVWDLTTDFIMQSGIKECHNLAMELEWLGFFIDPSIMRRTDWDDTMGMSYACLPRSGTNSLEAQSVINFGFNLKAQSPVDPSHQQWWLKHPIRSILRYNGMDSKWTNLLSRVKRPQMEAEHHSRTAYARLNRLAPTLAQMDLRGLPTSMAHAQQLELQMTTKVKEIEAKIAKTKEVKAYTDRFGTFDPGNSHNVLKLYDVVMERSEIFKENRGVVTKSTDEEVLSLMPKTRVPSAALILEHRSLDKLLGTYVRPVTEGRLIAPDGRMHAKYSAMRTLTWRLAAEDPNSMNWPKRKHREVRGIVTVEGTDYWILACDYGQIEFRVAGMLSEDENLVKYCWTGYDVHKFWAERIVALYPKVKDYIVDEFGVDWDEKGLKTLRQEAKNGWVFPSIFGAGLQSRAANLHIPEEKAEKLDREFWDEFPGVKRWQENLLEFYDRNLFVETANGLRRYGPMSKNEIINMPIQGTAAVIVTEAQCAISERAEAEDRPWLMPMLNVHDDLTSQVKDHQLETTIKDLVYEMCMPRFDWINVPIVVEVSVGTRWDNLDEIAKYSSEQLFNLRNPYRETAHA